MQVNKFVEKLRRYPGLTIDSVDAQKILDALQIQLEGNPVLTTKNFHKWFPNWKNLKSIEISFIYQPYFNGLNIHTKTIAKDQTICTDYEDFENNSPFTKRMERIITSDTVYKKEFVKECFEKALLDEFKNLKIKLIIGKCDRGNDI